VAPETVAEESAAAAVQDDALDELFGKQGPTGTMTAPVTEAPAASVASPEPEATGAAPLDAAPEEPSVSSAPAPSGQ
ncbi:MAG: hypothetical protein SGI88_19910, partial [Candidatus Hydrogenedentes bacterium]|nr:hypothetical protein [Candidatus Hydrogenedentota bacterium]